MVFEIQNYIYPSERLLKKTIDFFPRLIGGYPLKDMALIFQYHKFVAEAVFLHLGVENHGLLNRYYIIKQPMDG